MKTAENQRLCGGVHTCFSADPLTSLQALIGTFMARYNRLPEEIRVAPHQWQMIHNALTEGCASCRRNVRDLAYQGVPINFHNEHPYSLVVASDALGSIEASVS